MGLRARFDGTAVLTRLAIDADMARLRGPDFAAGTVNLETRGTVGSAAPKFDGRIASARATGSTDMSRPPADTPRASEERRAGKGCVGTVRTRCSPDI